MSKLQEALEEVQHTHIKEVDEMNAQLERQRDRTEELTEAVSTLISFIFQNRLQFRSTPLLDSHSLSRCRDCTLF